MKKIIHTFIFSFLICLLLIPVSAVYANNTEINIGDVTAAGGETAEVPITLSGNSGICGANIAISYDKGLQLTGITKGAALPNLTMTKPGDITSNPFVIVWDGMEADSTNGTIAVLTFKTPENAGEYGVNISYNDGDIVDGNLTPINVRLKQGSVTIPGVGNACVNLDGADYELTRMAAEPGALFVSFYDINGKLSSLKVIKAFEGKIVLTSPEKAKTAKIMWLGLRTLKPVSNAKFINLK